jgi:hypothetical protein
VSDQQLQVLGVQWNTPDPDAIARIAEYTTRPAWQAQLDQYAKGAAQTVQDTALRNIVEGRNPLTVAREVRRMVEGLPARQANNFIQFDSAITLLQPVVDGLLVQQSIREPS